MRTALYDVNASRKTVSIALASDPPRVLSFELYDRNPIIY